MDETAARQTLFELFNEIAIIDQLTNNVFNRCMPLGLSVAHFSVVNHLTRLGDGRTPVSIARAFQVTKPTMTSTLTRLESLGLVRIDPNPKDGRSKLVYLTEAGRQFRVEALAALAPAMAGLAKDLDLEALAGLLPTLRELRRYLDTHRPEDGS